MSSFVVARSPHWLRPGSQLSVRLALYWHHGIYVGRGRVIQYSGWIRGPHGLIEEVSLEEFSEGLPFGITRTPPSLSAGLEVVRRARSRLGERGYDLLANNCEHFCTWCCFGAGRSRQVERLGSSSRYVVSRLQRLIQRFAASGGATVEA